MHLPSISRRSSRPRSVARAISRCSSSLLVLSAPFVWSLFPLSTCGMEQRYLCPSRSISSYVNPDPSIVSLLTSSDWSFRLPRYTCASLPSENVLSAEAEELSCWFCNNSLARASRMYSSGKKTWNYKQKPLAQLTVHFMQKQKKKRNTCDILEDMQVDHLVCWTPSCWPMRRNQHKPAPAMG